MFKNGEWKHRDKWNYSNDIFSNKKRQDTSTGGLTNGTFNTITAYL